MLNRNDSLARPAPLGLLVTLLAAGTGCADAAEPADDSSLTTPPESEVRTVELDVFEAPDLQEGVAPCQQIQQSASLDPGVILAARTQAVADAGARARQVCGSTGVAFFSAELDETSYYETVETTCLDHRNATTETSSSVELYAATVRVSFECGGSASGVEQTESLVSTDPVPNGPDRPYIEPNLGPIVLECEGEGDPSCCGDLGCCMDQGGGAGYCTARHEIDHPASPENRF
jgi:hypothetical protein